ncbi:Rho-binding antiterminator [uncultured Paraglaciecola sp.]|uniref:Rho-binding antiterminator n=1 Tax=uncultured Paraglaciecola sp. TaxID=1765024 RepID=UPI00262DA647|nr:Rho-binding antiterminator [uncultured Paraglaciecola sp.]
MSDPILACHLHDYLEIACLYNIEVNFTLKSGDILTGLPRTTEIRKGVGECLIFRQNACKEDTAIPVLSLKTMQAISHNMHFDTVDF